MERLMQRNSYSEKEARERINAQLPMNKKCELGDIIIDNSKNVEFTKRQIINEFRLLDENWIIWKVRLFVMVVLILFLLTLWHISYQAFNWFKGLW